MRGGSALREIQEYGILEGYKRALAHDNLELAEEIVLANPQVPQAKFQAIFKEYTGEEEHGEV